MSRSKPPNPLEVNRIIVSTACTVILYQIFTGPPRGAQFFSFSPYEKPIEYESVPAATRTPLITGAGVLKVMGEGWGTVVKFR
jgi:hypothetical protein